MSAVTPKSSSRILLQQPANQVCSERPSGSGKEAHTEPNADQVEGNRHRHVDLLQQLLLWGWGSPPTRSAVSLKLGHPLNPNRPLGLSHMRNRHFCELQKWSA